MIGAWQTVRESQKEPEWERQVTSARIEARSQSPLKLPQK